MPGYYGITDEQRGAGTTALYEQWAKEGTRSGSNFGDTATGAQNIYDSGDYGYFDSDAVNQRVSQPWEADIVGTPWYDYGGGGTPTSSPSGMSERDKWNADLQKELDAKRAREAAEWNTYGGAGGGKRVGGSGGSSGGGYGTYGNIVTGQQRSITPPGPMPTMDEMPEFLAPEREDQRVKELTQQKSAAGLRAMRAQIQKAMGQGYRNENVKRMTLRDALAGYGQGIESVMSGAQTQAEKEYNTEYAQKYDTAGKNWQTAVTLKMQDWQNKVADYMRQYGTSQTTVRV